MIRLFVNLYTVPDPRRNAELQECLRQNRQNVMIDQIITLHERPTFAEFFARANQCTADNDISIIANSDIYFDGSIRHLHQLRHDECFALTRWDVKPDGTTTHWQRPDSQDAWCFRGKIRAIAAPFTPGVRGCDNRLAWLLHEAAYRVTNPSVTIRALHLHLSEIRRYGHQPADIIPGPYLTLPLIAFLSPSLGTPGEGRGGGSHLVAQGYPA